MNCILHRFRHGKRVLRTGNGRIHEHRIGAVFHRQSGVRRGSDAGIHDDRHLDGFHDDFQIVWITDTEPGSDGRR